MSGRASIGVKPKPRCAECGGAKNHENHIGSTWTHNYQDERKAGLKPMSEGKREYLASQEHADVYSRGDAASCAAEAAGVPTRCYGRLSPHHIAPRGSFGGQRAAEKFPVVTVCEFHNGWFQQDDNGREWARSHFFHQDGKDWPFLLSPKDEQAKTVVEDL